VEPSRAHIRFRAGIVQGLREDLQVVVEQVGVDIESHRSGCVAEHPLDCFDASPDRNRKARGSVPEVVRCQTPEGLAGFHGANDCDSDPAVAVRRPIDVIGAVAEDQLAGILAFAGAGQLERPERRERNCASCMVLRGANDDAPVDADGVLADR
jgi:hypothetical protein